MLLHKSNLVIHILASSDKRDVQRHMLFVADDGTTVATNGKSLIAVEPLRAELMAFPAMAEGVKLDGGVGLPLELVKRLLKDLPPLKLRKLQCVDLQAYDGMLLTFAISDLEKENRLQGMKYGGRFVRWVTTLRRLVSRACRGRVCISRRSLMKTLEAMDKAADDKSNESPVFMEIGGRTDGIVLRTVNYETGQQIVGAVMPMDVGESWLKPSTWARKFLSAKRRKQNGQDD